MDKRGYLNEGFRYFHLYDAELPDIRMHFHEFNKIVIFLSGNASYTIEGVTYDLKPGDILLVNHHLLHQPRVSTGVVYERLVFWINETYINTHNMPGCNLFNCFENARRTGNHLLCIDESERKEIENITGKIEEALESEEFASELLGRTYFIQLMIMLNRISEKKNDYVAGNYRCHDKVKEIMLYINENLSNDLSVQHIADKFYLSRYYLMHLFKEEVGDTIHRYVLQKRLSNAAELIKSGMSANEAALQSGFEDYTTFLRAFTRVFHKSPGKLKNSLVPGEYNN